jgi:hypothetical protein
VFVREGLELAVPVTVVRERILTQQRADGLHAVSSAALDLGRRTPGSDGHSTGDSPDRDGETMTRRAPQLSVHTLPATTRGPVTIVPIRWLIDDVGDGQPVLDADLEIGPAETADTTLLQLVGIFRPIVSRTDPIPHQQWADRIPRDLLTTVAALLALNPTPNGVEHSV